MMKKNTLKIALFLTLGFIAFSINAQTIYFEDFRYENEDRGFTIQKVALNGQDAAQVGKRVGDVVDATDSSPVFDESSRPVNRIPAGITRDQRAIAFSNTSGAEETLANHEIEAWAFMTNQDLSSTNSPKVSFWTEQRSVTGGGAVLSIWVSENYTHGTLPNTATWTNETANITGNIATSDVSPLTYVYGSLDLSAYSGSSVTVAFKVTTDNTTYTKDVNHHGTFYISDVKFEASKEDVANGAFSALNTSSTGQTGIFNTTYASIEESNFSNTSKWADVLTTQAAVPRLANGLLIPIGEGYKFEVADKYNPIALSEVRYVFVNGASNKGAPGNSKWIVQGSNDDSTWDDLSAVIEMFSATNDVETSATLTTTKAYRYYRFSLATAWTPNSAYTALKQLDFTIDNSVLSIKKDVLNTAFTVYPNPTNSIINISKLNTNIKNVKLIDITGKVIYKNNNAQPINVRNYSKGLYFLKIESQEGTVANKKVIIN
jgi:hypothetical protein